MLHQKLILRVGAFHRSLTSDTGSQGVNAVLLLWCSPVYHVNVAREVDNSFFPRLAHAAEAAFSAYEQRASVRAATANDGFYEWQRLRGYQRSVPAFTRMPEFAQLESLIYSKCIDVLRACRVAPALIDLVESGALSTDIWTSVHRDGSSHGTPALA